MDRCRGHGPTDYTKRSQKEQIDRHKEIVTDREREGKPAPIHKLSKAGVGQRQETIGLHEDYRRVNSGERSLVRKGEEEE